MIYLIFSAFLSLLLVVIFKLFGKYKIETLQAIVINYIVCVAIGCTIVGVFPFQLNMINEPWFPIIALLGFLFVGGFYIASTTVQYFGIAIASVAQRMSLVISVSFAILFFNDVASFSKIIGVLTALTAVILINIPNKNKENNSESTNDNVSSKGKWIYPVSIFGISGLIEIILNYTQKTYELAPNMQCILLFGSASFIGIIALVIALISKRIQLKSKNILAGIILGIPNFFSIYFLLLALQNLESSIVYPVTNILIVGSSAVVGYFVFKEKLSVINILGVGLALLSIILITT